MSIHAFVKLPSYKNLFFRVILVKKAQATILKKKISNFQICQNQFLYWKTQPIGTWKLQYVLAGFGIWGARLCTCLKHWRLAKKSTPCLIKRASTCAADCMSKPAKFFYLSLSIKHKDLTRKSCVFVHYFIGSVVKMALSEAATRGILWKKVFLKIS